MSHQQISVTSISFHLGDSAQKRASLVHDFVFLTGGQFGLKIPIRGKSSPRQFFLYKAVFLKLWGGRGSRVVRVSDRGWPCHEFEPGTTKDPPCRAAMHVKSVEGSNDLTLVWCGRLQREVPAKVSSTLLHHGSKLRHPSPKALV
ncbi:hypothetical protein TNCV_903831 [Trichonephila clavipes]|nr:hypothetical protein TNCV_903831 [Trichonephila clavipes]